MSLLSRAYLMLTAAIGALLSAVSAYHGDCAKLPLILAFFWLPFVLSSLACLVLPRLWVSSLAFILTGVFLAFAAALVAADQATLVLPALATTFGVASFLLLAASSVIRAVLSVVHKLKRADGHAA